ncbi:hypothetical protein BDN70DRAFT_204414 [Pholiota conissans]|uniref:Uncharacterized protein n=1 Tax=Pholiota conissans TaxID=109636 RepID=A0A9P5YWC7_9AGAR|nr:hypothetical protein BDN70DRAFT_204414 [Pholiota conissans]
MRDCGPRWAARRPIYLNSLSIPLNTSFMTIYMSCYRLQISQTLPRRSLGLYCVVIWEPPSFLSASVTYRPFCSHRTRLRDHFCGNIRFSEGLVGMKLVWMQDRKRKEYICRSEDLEEVSKFLERGPDPILESWPRLLD